MKMEKEKMTIILFSGEMDKAIAAFTLATTAAASGMDVSIFFTFWGLNVLKNDIFAIGGKKNILQRMFNLMSTKTLPTTRLNMFGLGPLMMRMLMKSTGAAPLEDLMNLSRQLGVKYIACTTSCGILGLSEKDMSGDVDEFAGAATYLGEARSSKINLFI